MKKIGVVRFLGTNCDADVFEALNAIEGLESKWLWYEDRFKVEDVDGVVIPGGFSYGDYLRCGALASKMPVMDSVKEAAQKGLPILGICNGFQVLCESGILPGVLTRNKTLKFIDGWSNLEPVGKSSLWSLNEDVSCPIAHGEGRYFIHSDDLKKIEDKDQIWLKYSSNPNGSLNDIAGVTNEEGNVAGLMPHPERAMAKWMGGDQGKKILERFC